MALANDSILVTPGTGATVATHLASAKEYQAVVLADANGFVYPGHALAGVSVSESVAASIAATWYLKRQWQVPSGVIFRPARAVSVVTTAGTRTLIASGQKLGTFNLSTNAFTDGASVASPLHYDRMLAIITSVMSATADTVTVTYTNESGTTGRTTVGLALPASSLGGTAFEFVLSATTGQMRDVGVRDVTAVSDTAAPTGVIEIWGLNAILDAQGVANAYESAVLPGMVIPDTETVFIMFFQAATTAQQRAASIVGTIT